MDASGLGGRGHVLGRRSCSVTDVFRSLAVVLANGKVLLRWQDAVVHQRPGDEQHRSRQRRQRAGRATLPGPDGLCRPRDAERCLPVRRVHARMAGGQGSRDSATVLVRGPSRGSSPGCTGHPGRAAALQPLRVPSFLQAISQPRYHGPVLLPGRALAPVPCRQ